MVITVFVILFIAASEQTAFGIPQGSPSTSENNGIHLNSNALDNKNLIISEGPTIPNPPGTIVITPIYNACVSHNTTSTITNNSVNFPQGNFYKIEVTFFDQYISNPFDDSYVVIVNGVQIMSGNTLELENTSASENVSQYEHIFTEHSSVTISSPQFNPGYASRLSVWFTFYTGNGVPEPNLIIPAFTDIGFPTPKNAFPVNVPIPFNVSKSASVSFPMNITSAYLNLYEQQNGNDEFWYTLQPPFREFRIYINNTLIATVQPYPNIQTGGGDLFLWQPILPIGAVLYPQHVINLNPYLSILRGTKNVTLEVVNDENLWIRVALNFMLFTNNIQNGYGSANVSFHFQNNYHQTPETNLTSESIPFSAQYLNDSEFTNETLSSYGFITNGNELTASTTFKTVKFFANSTEFDPCFNIINNTPFGIGLVYIQHFYLKENIEYVTITKVYATNGNAQMMISETKTIKQEYFQINGTDFEYLIFSPSLIVIGFNVTQIKNTSIMQYQFGNERNLHYNIVDFNYTSKVVTGNGVFAGTLNSENEITSLVYNHAITHKIVLSRSISDHSYTVFYLNEEAINDSLVNRNGSYVYIIVKYFKS
ncbi:peptide-N4-asparagine amidase [Thermoplasma sp.]|uniref:peptide-N4-asparagine amidase n=1 Tax=Thermoplasma sp. TaxID=1973142 RepID=UPI0025E60B2D|nr:peptide-N4-asparagine amidase [Thermoplasma sp.]